MADDLPAMVYGHHPDEGLVAVEVREDTASGPNVTLFHRRGGRLETSEDTFRPFLWLESASLAKGCPGEPVIESLTGPGRYQALATFGAWSFLARAKTWLGQKTRRNAGDPESPYFLITDPAQQYLMASGRTLFRGLAFEDVRRLQVDIETHTAPGYEFCNADRESDRVLLIALADSTGWTEILEERGGDEKRLLERFVEAVRARDPDVIEGHNLFKFDLPYLAARAKRHGVKLALGRDGSPPRTHPSRFSAGDRTVAYPKAEIHGRHVVDTMFLLQLYDLTQRALNGYGLKDAAIHFGFARPDRTYIEGAAIAREYQARPDLVRAYAADDIAETARLADLLSRTYFAQAQMLPFPYQDVCVRGNATKIDALLLREYLRRRQAVPAGEPAREFAGGYTDIFVRGVVRDVHHVDVRSLYPSLMLARRLGPASDSLGVFLETLAFLRTFRLEAKARMQRARGPERLHHDALQSAFKILINSFYGYLGFSQAHFNDYTAAERVTAEGRDLLRSLIVWLRDHGATPVEIDTDGIYFTPPPGLDAPGLDRFQRAFESSLPEGLEVEFDGRYEAMFSYKMKNYALLEKDGEIILKGAALKSRGLEPYLRQFLRDYVRHKLLGQEDRIPALREALAADIREGRLSIALLAKTETLRDSPAVYSAKLAKTGRGRNAAYELALKSGRDYQAGDQISYYITGTKKRVAAHSAARLVSDWNPAQRDENTAYYLDKLDALLARLEAGAGEDGDGGPESEDAP
jgi:DNA polymerase elongation subunit (family B)